VCLKNNGDTTVDLEGCFVQDMVGTHKSKAFAAGTKIQAGAIAKVWMAPKSKTHGGPAEESATDIFWRNLGDGLPRTAPVLNDDGDGIQLMTPAKKPVCNIAAKPSESSAKSFTSLSMIGIDLKDEFVTLKNSGDKQLSLQGCYLQDFVGTHKSKPFTAKTKIGGGVTAKVWMAPSSKKFGGPKKENGENFFWRNVGNGQPRSAPVLNDSGDGVQLMSPGDEVICKIMAQTVSAAAPSTPKQTKKSPTKAASSKRKKPVEEDDDTAASDVQEEEAPEEAKQTKKQKKDEAPKFTDAEIGKMKVSDLKSELQILGLSTEGLKKVLVIRLKAAMK